MTYQEEINALRDKISKYEELLEKVMDGPFMESTIISQHNGLYRVMVNGNEIIIPKSPKLTENPENEGLRARLKAQKQRMDFYKDKQL